MNRVVSFGVILCGLLLGGCVNSGDASSASVRAQEFPPSRLVIKMPGGVIETNGVFYIPADEEWVYSEAVEIRAYGVIIIDGVMRGLQPYDSSVQAPSMTLQSASGIIVRGQIKAFPGADGSYPGANGGDAGSLSIHTPILVLNDRLVGASGGAGFPDDGRGANRKATDDVGRGGTGGPIEVFAQVVGPYAEREENAMVGYVNIVGGTGGYGGGTGGSAATGHYRELPWMVKYRRDYLMSDGEIEAARQRGEIR